MVNWYRDFWRKQSTILAPLTDLTKPNPKQFTKHWTDTQDRAFAQVKSMIGQDILLRYPDPNRPFIIHPDASNYQLGAAIFQADDPNDKTILRPFFAFFSRKVSPAQRRYPAVDKEALSIVEVLHEYRAMLYGADIVICPGHKNLTQPNMGSHRLLHWRLLIEEFCPRLSYQPGPSSNVVGDALSRLP